MNQFFHSVIENAAGELLAAIILLTIGIAFGIPRRIATFLREEHGKLIARLHDSSGFFDDTAISNALRYYVRPKFQNIDPSREAEPAQALLYARDDLFQRIQRFINQTESDDRHLFLFADSGMGKTTFLVNYFAWEHRIYRPRRWKTRLISLANRSANEQISAVPLPDRKCTNLFLDALDEDQSAIGRVSDRISEIFHLTEGFRRVVITCRTQFFESDDQIPENTGVARIGPTPARRSKHYLIRKIYLSPFDESQVEMFLSKRFPGLFGIRDRRRARALIDRVPSLSVRPMLLAHMPDLLDTTIQVRRSIDVYEAMIDAWTFRERDWINPSTLRAFSSHLAIDLFLNKASRGGEFAKPGEITRIASSMGITVGDNKLTARSLLNRTSDGNYKFAHRSIMEYLVVLELLGLTDGTNLDITDQMSKFLFEFLACESAQGRELLDKANFRISLSAPIRKLGHLTNFGLYQHNLGNPEPSALLNLSVATVGSSIPKSLFNLISEMVSSSFRTELKSVRSIRVHADLSNSSTAAKLYISVWVNSYGVLCEAVAPDLSPVIQAHPEARQHKEICFCAENPNGLESIHELSWSMKSRMSLCEFPFDGFEASRDEASLIANTSIGFSYDPEHNRVSVQLIEGVSRPADALGHFANFGIFGAITPIAVDNQMPTIGPVRIEHLGPMRIGDSHARAGRLGDRRAH